MILPIAIFYLVSLFCRQSDTVCQLECSVSFVCERMRCTEDSSKTGNMCGERPIYFLNAVIDKYHKSDK